MSQLSAKFVQTPLKRQVLTAIHAALVKSRTTMGVDLQNNYAQKSQGNKALLEVGEAQRKNVLPEKLKIADNSKRVGVWNKYGKNKKKGMLDVETFERLGLYQYKKRTVRIYQPDIRAVQSTPRLKVGGKWVIQFEPFGIYKSHLMGWGSATSDPFYKWTIHFETLQDAITYAENLGWGFEVEYPKERWSVRKSYSDNFKWRGPARSTSIEQQFQ